MGFLSRKDNATLLAYLNNGADGMLADEARRELAARGMLPEWAAAPSAPDNVQSNLDAAATPVALDPAVTPRAPRAGGLPGGATTRTPGGLEVPVAYEGADGAKYYTFGDERRAKEAEDEAYRLAGGRSAAPLPRSDDGSPTGPAREFSSPAEAEQYYTRPRDAYGQLQPSQYDIDMRRRGMEPVYNEHGEITYRRAAPTDLMGRVRDDIAPGERRYSNYLLGTSQFDNGTILPHDEVADARGPFGPVRVIVPTKATRDRQKRRETDASISRIAARTGMTREELAAMSPAERANVMRDHREADEQRRRDFVRRRAMMVGGSENLNPTTRARFGTLEALGDPGMNDWQKMVLAETMLREPQRMTPLGAEAVGASNAMRMMNADIFAQGLPGAMDARQRAKDAERLQELRAVAGQAYRIASPSMRRDAVEAALIGEGASAEERAAVMNDLPGLGGPMPGATPPPGASTLPNGAPQARWPVGPR